MTMTKPPPFGSCFDPEPLPHGRSPGPVLLWPGGPLPALGQGGRLRALTGSGVGVGWGVGRAVGRGVGTGVGFGAVGGVVGVEVGTVIGRPDGGVEGRSATTIPVGVGDGEGSVDGAGDEGSVDGAGEGPVPDGAGVPPPPPGVPLGATEPGTVTGVGLATATIPPLG
jgi:hypothetical protein